MSTEPDRCERAFVGNTIGQANGVYDKPIDLRFCDYTNEKSNLKGKSLAAALMSDAKFDGADMSEVVMSKAYAVGASFKGDAPSHLLIVFCLVIYIPCHQLMSLLRSTWNCRLKRTYFNTLCAFSSVQLLITTRVDIC